MEPARYEALVVKEPNSISIETRELRPLEIDEILVKPLFVGICATDLEIMEGKIDPSFVSYPIVIGHEWTAEIVDDPSGNLKPGTPVIVEGILPCGRCTCCLDGQTNLCEIYAEIGFTHDGGASQLAIIPLRSAHPLNPKVSPKSAALIEPAAVVYRGLTRVSPKPGITAVIIGDGTIALLSAYLLQLWNPSTIVMVGRNNFQADLAIKAGVSEFTTDDSKVNGRFDLAIEASGSLEASSTALSLLRRGGTLLVLGLPPHGAKTPISIDEVVNNDLTIIGSFSYTAKIWRELVQLTNSLKFDPGFLITHTYTFNEWELALNAIKNTTKPRGKVLLEVNSVGGT